jgi:UDP-N-acetylglucosamine--N-acetylmuramyl-(pentapeptide) pyrophosphoryl-undecaprenol N-acetylglucosamine transferase
MTSSGSAFAFVTGGGTGGHVYPALSVADALVARGHTRDEVRFVGSRRGIEARVVPDAGYPIELLGGRGVQRSLRPRAVLVNVGAVFGLAGAFLRSLRLVGRYRPRVVVGVGGYASFPCVAAARCRRVPAVVHEQNAAPGLANRWAVRMGARAAVSLPGTELGDAVLTGNPVRQEIVDVRRHPDGARPLVGVVGGSLGARRVNDAALELYGAWRARPDVTIRHVSGPRDFQRCGAALDTLRAPSDRLAYELVEYEEHMPDLYARASVLVGRAGAVTCAELAVTGTPSILVPLPGAPDDHQTANARALEAGGAAILVADADLDGPRLAQELDALLRAPRRLDGMGDAARAMGRPDAAARVADLVEAAAGLGDGVG